MNLKMLNKIMMSITLFFITVAVFMLYSQEPILSQEENTGFVSEGLPPGSACSDNYECNSYACCGSVCEESSSITCLFDSDCDDNNPCTVNSCSTKVTDVKGACSATVIFPDISDADYSNYQCVTESSDPLTCGFIEGQNPDKQQPPECPTTPLTCQCPAGFIARPETVGNCAVDNSLTGTLGCQAYDSSCGSTENHYANNCNLGANAAVGSCVCCEDADGDGTCDDSAPEEDVCNSQCINRNLPDGTDCSLAGASGYCDAGNCVLSEYASLPLRLMWVINETVVVE